MTKETIWFSQPEAEQLNNFGKGTMSEFLGIRFKEIGNDFISATMPHSPRTMQPYGFMHGGANVVLAETLGSVASTLVVDHSKYQCVGLEVNASHLRSVRGGVVTALCRPVRLGRTTHVWQIDITDDRGKITCSCRLTVAVIAGRQPHEAQISGVA